MVRAAHVEAEPETRPKFHHEVLEEDVSYDSPERPKPLVEQALELDDPIAYLRAEVPSPRPTQDVVELEFLESTNQLVGTMTNPTVNPKELAAAARPDKPPLHLLEHAADIEISWVMKHGADKYGRRNFRDSPMKASVYIGAIRRHAGALANGEDIDPESGRSHWAHIGACAQVILSAMDAGTFEDDR